MVTLSSCAVSIFSPQPTNAEDAHYKHLKKANEAQAEQWKNAGENALGNATVITGNSNSNTGSLSATAPAKAFQFRMKAGQKSLVLLKPTPGVYMALYERNEKGFSKIIVADTVTNDIQVQSTNGGDYYVRLLSRMPQAVNFSFSITTESMFGWPIQAGAKASVGSRWGDARDGGARKHEGIDIMAASATPVVAIANGTISRVGYDNLGGNVITLRPDGSKLSAYYAHLSRQLVEEGDGVVKGQVIGLVGNSGNAINTPPHLHFGIYGSNGAIDPLYFVYNDAGKDQNRKTASKRTAK